MSLWHRAGEWAFKQRSWLPVPIAVVLLLSRAWEIPGDIPLRAGIALVCFGEFLRLWTVRQIGVISRTRAARWGPLVVSGPYRLVRNPIYVGNWLLWTGFVVWSGLLWMLPIAWLVFALQYAAIVRWEETGLLAHFGHPYADYLRSVPRWFPRGTIAPAANAELHTWNEVLFSERGTLAAIVLMGTLLIAKRLYFGAMTTFAALLRAVNLGPHNKVAMPDLATVFGRLGLKDVRTLLQSGNVVFKGDRSAGNLERVLEQTVATELGLKTDVMVRTQTDLDIVIGKNPFPAEASSDPSHLVVVFLKAIPSKTAVAELQKRITGRESVRARGSHLYIVYPDGIGRSGLTGASIDRVIGTSGTGRNWNTVLRIRSAM